MSTYLPGNEMELLAWARNYLAVAEKNKAALDLTDDDINRLKEDIQFCSEQLEASGTLKTKLTSSLKTKDDSMKRLKQRLRKLFHKTIGAENIQDSLKAELGLNPDSGARSLTAPTTPYDLVANFLIEGNVELYWNRSGNIRGTHFIIEMQAVTTNGWVLLDVITGCTYLHKEPPSVPEVKYRISARRRKETSAPSAPVTIVLLKGIPS